MNMPITRNRKYLTGNSLTKEYPPMKDCPLTKEHPLPHLAQFPAWGESLS